MKQVSAGSSTLWGISDDNSLYFREGVTNHYPEGTDWIKVSDFIQFVTVNTNNEVINVLYLN